MRAPLAGFVAIIVLLGCSTGSREDTEPLNHDDDSARLSHCAFANSPEPLPRPSMGAQLIKAGIASEPLLLPIGAPLGGYGARSTAFGGRGKPIDERARRFTTVFVPSAGLHDVPRADALALEVGGERVVLIRADLPLITENTLFEIENRLAPDGTMRGRVVLTASHSHAAWAGWQTSYVLIPGIDTPQRDLFERMVASLALAGAKALAALAPARIGFAARSDLDRGNLISHDRRKENDLLIGPDGNRAGQAKDPWVWALRVDRASGEPLAALISIPIHGTVGGDENPLVSRDAPGAIERALSAALGYPAFHIQGAAGDVSPTTVEGRPHCVNPARCLDIPSLEVIGARAVDQLAPLIEEISTEARAELEIVTRTVYIGRSTVVHRNAGVELFYPPPTDVPDGVIFDANGTVEPRFDEFTARSGAGLCGDASGSSLAPMPHVAKGGPYASCLDLEGAIGVFSGLFHLPKLELPLCDTVRTTLSALRLSLPVQGSATFVTLPGEPTAPLAAYLRGQAPLAAERTFLIGYAQDYVGYLLTAEDWLAGGYEPSVNIWGPLEGEMVMHGALDVLGRAATPEQDGPLGESSRLTKWSFPERAITSPIITEAAGTVPSEVPGTLFLPDRTAPLAAAQPESSIERIKGVAHFAWLGGDPAIDFPEVTIEKSAADKFEALIGPHGSRASSAEGVVLVTYTPDPLSASEPPSHFYVATWQAVPPDPLLLTELAAPFRLPIGRYRFHVHGRVRKQSGETPYEVLSAPFSVTAATADALSAVRVESALRIEARFGTAPGLRALGTGVSDANVPLPGPWSVRVRFGDGGTVTRGFEPEPPGTAMFPLSPDELAHATGVEVRDGAGNGGSVDIH